MTKDYAKKRRSSLASRAKGRYVPAQQPALMPAWAWMCLGIILGVSLSAMLYWKNHAQPKGQANVVFDMENASGKKQITKRKKTHLAKEADPSRFDFYTLLPNMAGDHLTEETLSLAQSVKTEAPTANNNSLPKATASFVIQAGSFRQVNQAEELKAKLAMTGFEASIQTININDKGKWFRVTVGPYENKEKAQNQQQKLDQAHQLHSVLIKNRV